MGQKKTRMLQYMNLMKNLLQRRILKNRSLLPLIKIKTTLKLNRNLLSKTCFDPKAYYGLLVKISLWELGLKQALLTISRKGYRHACMLEISEELSEKVQKSIK